MSSPFVGIFWRYKTEIIGWRCPVAEGDAVGDIVDSPQNHYPYWPVLQKARTELRGLEYEDVPRGRVLFVRPLQTSRVLLNRKLLRPTIQRQIARYFSLDSARTEFLDDQ